jgi:hypothetical protein
MCREEDSPPSRHLESIKVGQARDARNLSDFDNMLRLFGEVIEPLYRGANGRLANFSSERLMRLLTALGQDLDITVGTKPCNRSHGRIRVLGEVHA